VTEGTLTAADTAWARLTRVAQRVVTPGRVRFLAGALGCGVLAWMFYDHAVKASMSIDGVRYFWIDDDQMISMRYARNLAEGHGLVWNPGEYVEGYSNLLWVLLMAAVHALGAPDTQAALWMQGINFALHLGILYLSLRLLRVFVPDARAAAVLLVAGLVFSMDITFWSVNGFETNLLAVLQLGFLVSLFARGESWPTWLALTLIPLVRSDGVHVWAGDALLAVALSRDRARTLGRLALTLVPVAAHFGWRRFYYGDWLPNTYYLKSVGLPDKTLTGVLYVGRFLLRYGVVLAIACGAAAALLRSDRRAFSFFATVVTTVAYSCVVGGDNFEQCRFFAHTLPVVWVFASLAGHLLIQQPLGRAGLYVALAASLVPQRAPHPIHAPSVNGDPHYQIIVGVMLREQALADSTVAVIPAGFVPYFSRLRAHDMLGKTDAHIARLPYVPFGLPAHGKYDPEYSFGRDPDLVVSCRSRAAVTSAPRRLAELERPQVDYSLSILASEPFRSRYLPYRIESPWLAARSQVYTHAGSPEHARRAQWRDPVVTP
jgi:arabinofuranosyltransferase